MLFYALLSLFLHSFLFLIHHCFGGLFLERIPASSHFRTFFCGKTSLSHTHTPLCKTRLVYVLFLFAQYFVITRYNLCKCVFVAAVGVALSVALQCGSRYSYIPYKSLSTSVFSLPVEPSLVFNCFFQSCRRSVACHPGISVLEMSNVLAYLIFCCVELEILCLFRQVCCVFALDCA